MRAMRCYESDREKERELEYGGEESRVCILELAG
jgi:hypothetical protein